MAVDAPGVRCRPGVVPGGQEEEPGRRLRPVLSLRTRQARNHEARSRRRRRRHRGPACNYNAGGLWSNPRQPDWSDMEWQMRNWLYFTWLSGDHNVEQHIHSLDKMAWAMKDVPPVKAVGLGGRQVRTGPEYRPHLRPSRRRLRVGQRRQAVRLLPAAERHRPATSTTTSSAPRAPAT